jgi:hypothetical protein
VPSPCLHAIGCFHQKNKKKFSKLSATGNSLEGKKEGRQEGRKEGREERRKGCRKAGLNPVPVPRAEGGPTTEEGTEYADSTEKGSENDDFHGGGT